MWMHLAKCFFFSFSKNVSFFFLYYNLLSLQGKGSLVSVFCAFFMIIIPIFLMVILFFFFSFSGFLPLFWLGKFERQLDSINHSAVLIHNDCHYLSQEILGLAFEVSMNGKISSFCFSWFDLLLFRMSYCTKKIVPQSEIGVQFDLVWLGEK